MDDRINDDLWALTEKEKETLRLIVRGHDAKSIARTLALSVHTVNERLREARRKMAVSSSREAARLLLAAEHEQSDPSDPQLFVDMKIGEDAPSLPQDPGQAPAGGARRKHRFRWIMTGAILMTFFALGLFALIALRPDAPPSPAATTVSAEQDPQAAEAARHFLVLIDQGRWDESYQATATAFRALNTSQIWADASEKARVPLGTMISRTLLSQESVPAPPKGYEMVKFRTRFTNKPEAIETVTLDREDGHWRVVGVTITSP